MKTLEPKSNIANKVRNTKLPRTKPLLPLFEVVSNSIHAINEASKAGQLTPEGEIIITIIRNGAVETLTILKDVDVFPINSFEVKDNGIGLNDENLNYFVESDTDHKIDIGGKGVGRFVCLKAFRHLEINSNYTEGGISFNRSFIFKATKEGFHDFREEQLPNGSPNGTVIKLSIYKDEFQKNVPKLIGVVANELITHFQLYFINHAAPKIIIRNQNNDFIDCHNYFETHFKADIQSRPFKVIDNDFTLFLTKSLDAQSHKIYFCAHNRAVREEGLVNKIVDLGKYPIISSEGNFYYQAFVVGKALDDNVDLERVGFTFPTEEGEDESIEDLSLAKIRKEAVNAIEELLEEYLNTVREKKLAAYAPIVKEELPQYNHVFHRRNAEVKKLQPNLTKDKLDIELYKIEADWKVEVKSEGIKLLDEKKDIQNLDEYKARYDKFITEFNEVGMSDLARYVIHRKAVIELLEKLLEKTEENKFYDEDFLHSIFWPIRTSTDEVPHDKQNLWLLDERLTYHSFLASDKRFEQIRQVDSTSQDRTDLLIYNDALAFAEDRLAPYQSFTIVEFKKPQRDNYQDYDPKKNPLDQVEKYIKEILAGKVTSRTGRLITVDPKMPFYVYIICDITQTLIDILHSREFDKTPDGQGYFKFYSKYFNAYIEVLPFEKVLSDAKKRNRILFEKLGIPQ